MKATTRIILALVLAFSLCFAFCLFVSAEEADENATEPQIAVSEENGASETVEEKQGFASVLWDFVADNADKIFSVANTALAVILMWLYKRSLIPSVGKSLSQINGAVTTTTAALEGQTNEMATTIVGFMQKIEPYLPLLKGLTDTLQSAKTEKQAQLVIDKGVFDLLGLIVEAGRVPDSVKEQYRLYKAKADAAMMEIERSGDSE